MKVGVIGSGKIGQTVGGLWAKAGHDVLFASRHPEELTSFIRELGATAAHSGTPLEAAKHGDVVAIAVPLVAVPALANELRGPLTGKVVIDTTNPYPQRDGKVAEEAIAGGKGTGSWFAEHFRGARVIKGFNTIYFETLEAEAHRASAKVAIPLAGDDVEALERASQLVRDAGFEPVVVGALARSLEFDAGTKPHGKPYDANQLRGFFT